MDADLPDPITNYNRQLARQRYQRREEYILGHHPGFNLVYWQRIIRAPRHVERWGRLRGWTRDQVLLTKALLISRMACVFIDHLITRMAQADILPRIPNAPRHSFISYRCAETRNPAAVADEAGNSANVVSTFYRELVTPAQAAEYFAIMPPPEAGAQVIQFGA